MSEELLNSNLGVRSAGAVGPKIGATGKQEESQAPAPPRTESFHSVFDIVADDESARAKPGATFTHRMPSNHFCVGTYLVVELNQPAAGATVNNPALNVIRRVTVRHGPQVQEYDYRVVASYMLGQMSDDQQRVISDAAGTSGVSPQTVIVPMFGLWWDAYSQGNFKLNNQGVPLFLLNSPIELEIELAPNAELLGTGASWTDQAYDTLKVVHILRKSTTSVYDGFRGKPWSFTGYDYQTIKNFALPDGATTSMDLTAFDGSSAGLYFNPVTTTNKGLNAFYALTTDIDRQEAFINGSSYLQLTGNVSPNSSRPLMLMLYMGVFGSTGGDPSVITQEPGIYVPFGGALEPSYRAEADETSPKYEGSFNLRDATKLTVELRNSGADPIETDALNIRYVQYTITDGDLRRVK